jgi:gliding motility-associated-like protein
VFINNSENADYYSWELNDSYVEEVYMPDYSGAPAGYEFAHTYYIPGSYSVTLTAYKEVTASASCQRSLTSADMVIVAPSLLDKVPNVFSPDGDGLNDFFLINEKNYNSVKYFEVTIFNVIGHKVYSYEGDINLWEGWDGTIRNSNRLAQEGVYYYFIKASGWDPVEYGGDQYAGFIYLFRGKK